MVFSGKIRETTQRKSHTNVAGKKELRGGTSKVFLLI